MNAEHRAQDRIAAQLLHRYTRPEMLHARPPAPLLWRYSVQVAQRAAQLAECTTTPARVAFVRALQAGQA